MPGYLCGMFAHDKEIVIFETPQAASEKFRYYMKYPTQRKLIAMTGFKRASREHRYVDRFRAMLKVLLRDEILS